uniref:Forminhomology 2 domaincontaining protein putative n=1 Tax=Albugo laibachii Nc14 TaxID=890382 RepID=F0W6T0_9STRA|nr:forminhomology 2 domaincontaining protein putative [Albugo laibachii Nc14]|eukprot:CCA16825.1 forminhomology 2 domaincontaining protein putative [Albugo laibachii Nc14]
MAPSFISQLMASNTIVSHPQELPNEPKQHNRTRPNDSHSSLLPNQNVAMTQREKMRPLLPPFTDDSSVHIFNPRKTILDQSKRPVLFPLPLTSNLNPLDETKASRDRMSDEILVDVAWSQQIKVQNFFQTLDTGKSERTSLTATGSESSSIDEALLDYSFGAEKAEKNGGSKRQRAANALADLFSGSNSTQDVAKSKKAGSTSSHPLAAMLPDRQKVKMEPMGMKKEPEVKNVGLHEMLKKSLHIERKAETESCESLGAKLALKDDPTYQQYFKMLKVGLPRPSVEHKMRADQLDPAILDCDPNFSLPESFLKKKASISASNTSSQQQEVDKLEAEYQQQLKLYREKLPSFERMLKVGLPRSAVEHKMQSEGCDPSWLDGPPKRKIVAGDEISPEELEAHKKKYEKFFAMLQYGIAREAVEHKMRQSGLDPAELDGPKRSSKTSLSGASDPDKAPSGFVRKKLHWETISYSNNAISKSKKPSTQSLWQCAIEKGIRSSLQMSDQNKQQLESLFVKKVSETSRKRPPQRNRGAGDPAEPNTEGSKALGANPKHKIALIDLKKSQNIAIVLARVKMSFSDLRREVLAMNPTVLSTSQIKTLIEMWPDRTEQQAIDGYKGSIDALGTTERFFVEVRKETRFRERLSCLVFKQEFSSRVFELRESIQLIIRAVHQVCSSQSLLQILVYILEVGNFLNFGQPSRNTSTADGFSLRSLSKLSQTKAFTGNTTVLQYIVQSVEREVPDLVRFYEEIKLVSKCSKHSLSALQAEKKALDEGQKKVLFEADSVNPSSFSLDEELAAPILKQFAAEVSRELEAINALLEQMEEMKIRFMEYFDESESTEDLDELLSHLANFIEEFQHEKQQWAEKKKRKEKADTRERKRAASSAQSSKSLCQVARPAASMDATRRLSLENGVNSIEKSQVKAPECAQVDKATVSCA